MLGARDHVTQRADVRDRPPASVTYSEPRGQYADVIGQRGGDVTGQYRERHYPEPVSRETYRGPATARYIDSTQDTAPGLVTPPWNKIPGYSSCFMHSFLRATALCDSAYSIARLSHGWISQKRFNLGSCNFHHQVAP